VDILSTLLGVLPTLAQNRLCSILIQAQAALLNQPRLIQLLDVFVVAELILEGSNIWILEY
jgi:hypothetical protein